MEQLIASIPALLLAFSQYVPYVAGFFMPPLVEVINRDVRDTRIQFLIAFGLCVVVAAALNVKTILAGTPETALYTLGFIFTESQATFDLWFRKSTLKAEMQRATVTP